LSLRDLLCSSSLPPGLHAPPGGHSATPKSHAERRSASRLPLSAAVHFTSRDNFFAGRTRDVSLGGLFIETSAALDIGTHIGVRIQIVDRAFAVMTEITWALSDRVGRPLGVGVRFLHMPSPLIDAIAAFTRTRNPIGFEFDASR
jgi:uncharacterized protein (TIGR02266 family)